MFAVILVALLSMALGSLATPLPLPMPLALMAPAYSNKLYPTRQTLNWTSSSHDLGDNLTANAIPLDPYNAGYTIRQQRALDTLTELYGHYSKARSHSKKLSTFAAQSADIEEDDLVFQQNAAAELAGFDSSLLGIKTILDQLGEEKGLMNYDRTNDIETLLKNVINFNKETLNAVDILVYNLPILGPILGPIVYEIKCILDDVLNAVENLTDAVINGLQPLLQALIGQASTTACHSGNQLLGLCI